MKIATFNANSIRSRLDVILAWLKANEPDALCIQETKVQDKDFPSPPIIEAGYKVVFRGEKSYNGVALIARRAPANVAFGLDDAGSRDETRLLCAQVGPVHIVNTYIPQGREIGHEMYQYKLAWLKRLKAYFCRHFSKANNLVWLGDMNVAPEAIDIHNAEKQANHVCYHVDARKAFADTVGWGFTDVFRKHHPEPGHYTFFDYRTRNAVKLGMGWRVDHILAAPALAEKCGNAFIDLKPRMAPNSSDHTFLVAEFDV